MIYRPEPTQYFNLTRNEQPTMADLEILRAEIEVGLDRLRG